MDETFPTFQQTSEQSKNWQLAGWPLGTIGAEMGLHAGVWVCPGVWTPNWGYTQVFGYVQTFGHPTGAAHGCLRTPRRLDPQMRFPTRATLRCLDYPPELHPGVWIPNRGYTRVFGVSNGRSCKLPARISFVSRVFPSTAPWTIANGCFQ